MDIYLKILDFEINHFKKNLYILLNCKELTNKDVVECSQKLDKLILKYEMYKKLN